MVVLPATTIARTSSAQTLLPFPSHPSPEEHAWASMWSMVSTAKRLRRSPPFSSQYMIRASTSSPYMSCRL